MFEEYQLVKLNRDLLAEGLQAGIRGTILVIYPGQPRFYEVEFLDDEGNTLAVITLPEELLSSSEARGVEG